MGYLIHSRKTYSEAAKRQTFEDRFNYLKLSGSIGAYTFGNDRQLNQALYQSYKWRKFSDEIVARDHNCDLGIPGRKIEGLPIIHHINPITKSDIINKRPCVFDPNNVICVSKATHSKLHYGTEGDQDGEEEN